MKKTKEQLIEQFNDAIEKEFYPNYYKIAVEFLNLEIADAHTDSVGFWLKILTYTNP